MPLWELFIHNTKLLSKVVGDFVTPMGKVLIDAAIHVVVMADGVYLRDVVEDCGLIRGWYICRHGGDGSGGGGGGGGSGGGD